MYFVKKFINSLDEAVEDDFIQPLQISQTRRIIRRARKNQSEAELFKLRPLQLQEHMLSENKAISIEIQQSRKGGLEAMEKRISELQLKLGIVNQHILCKIQSQHRALDSYQQALQQLTLSLSLSIDSVKSFRSRLDQIQRFKSAGQKAAAHQKRKSRLSQVLRLTLQAKECGFGLVGLCYNISLKKQGTQEFIKNLIYIRDTDQRYALNISSHSVYRFISDLLLQRIQKELNRAIEQKGSIKQLFAFTQELSSRISTARFQQFLGSLLMMRIEKSRQKLSAQFQDKKALYAINSFLQEGYWSLSTLQRVTKELIAHQQGDVLLRMRVLLAEFIQNRLTSLVFRCYQSDSLQLYLIHLLIKRFQSFCRHFRQNPLVEVYLQLKELMMDRFKASTSKLLGQINQRIKLQETNQWPLLPIPPNFKVQSFSQTLDLIDKCKSLHKLQTGASSVQDKQLEQIFYKLENKQTQNEKIEIIEQPVKLCQTGFTFVNYASKIVFLATLYQPLQAHAMALLLRILRFYVIYLFMHFSPQWVASARSDHLDLLKKVANKSAGANDLLNLQRYLQLSVKFPSILKFLKENQADRQLSFNVSKSERKMIRSRLVAADTLKTILSHLKLFQLPLDLQLYQQLSNQLPFFFCREVVGKVATMQQVFVQIGSQNWSQERAISPGCQKLIDYMKDFYQKIRQAVGTVQQVSQVFSNFVEFMLVRVLIVFAQVRHVSAHGKKLMSLLIDNILAQMNTYFHPRTVPFSSKALEYVTMLHNAQAGLWKQLLVRQQGGQVRLEWSIGQSSGEEGWWLTLQQCWRQLATEIQ